MENEQLNKILINSVQEVFKKMFSLSPMAIDKKVDLNDENNCVCQIQFTGDIEGALAIILSDETACKVASKLLGSEITESSEKVDEQVIQIAKNIGDTVKAKLVDALCAIKLDESKLIKGPEFQKTIEEDAALLELGLDCGDFTFDVIACYKASKKEESGEKEGADTKAILNDMIKETKEAGEQKENQEVSQQTEETNEQPKEVVEEGDVESALEELVKDKGVEEKTEEVGTASDASTPPPEEDSQAQEQQSEEQKPTTEEKEPDPGIVLKAILKEEDDKALKEADQKQKQEVSEVVESDQSEPSSPSEEGATEEKEVEETATSAPQVTDEKVTAAPPSTDIEIKNGVIQSKAVKRLDEFIKNYKEKRRIHKISPEQD